MMDDHGHRPDGADLASDVHAWFASRAAAHPDAIAIVSAEGETSYGELAARADDVCAFLLARGLQPEQPVGVYMQRRAEMLAVLLGIWKAGGCYVPFDPQDPPARVRQLLASAGCREVLGDRSLVHALRQIFDGAPEAPTLTQVSEVPVATAHGGVPPPGGGSRLAYMLFTSGSTGDPKAVEVEHASVVNLLAAMRDTIGLTARDRFVAVSTIAFDISVAELFLPLVTGGSLLMSDRRRLLEHAGLADDLRAHGVTVLQTGPTLWSRIIAAVPDFPRLRVIITGGEAIQPVLAQRLAGHADEVWNFYGPTEATIWATAQRLTAGMDASVSAMSAPI